MRFGAHLPLMDFGGNPYTLDHLVAYTATAAAFVVGNLRASSYNGASTYCEQKNLNAVMLRKAPGDSGVDFRCE